MLRTPFHLVELPPPRLSIPDLDVVGHAGDDDVPREPGVPEQGRGNHDPPLLVQLGLGRAGEEMALEPAAVGVERVQANDARLETVTPLVARPHIEASVHASRKDNAGRQLLAEARREREPVLVVDGVLVFAEKHDRAITDLPLLPTLDHYPPLCNPLVQHSHLVTRMPAPGTVSAAAAERAATTS